MTNNDTNAEGILGVDRSQHERHLGTVLWRTLDRLERSIADRQIEPGRAREIIGLVAELARCLPSPSATERLDQLRESRIHPRTQGSNA